MGSVEVDFVEARQVTATLVLVPGAGGSTEISDVRDMCAGGFQESGSWGALQL